MLDSLRSSLQSALDRIKTAASLDDKTLGESLKQVEKALLMADVSVDLVAQLSKNVREKSRSAEPPPGYTRKDVVLRAIYEELVSLLGGVSTQRFVPDRSKLNKVMLVGVEGSGKTTTAAKLALHYKNMGYKVGLVSLDNMRPAAVEQLSQLAKKVGVPFFGDPSLEPKKGFERAIEAFSGYGLNLILIDTAGRHRDEEGLMNEIEEISRFVKPDHVFLVLDANLGQSASLQAQAFASKTKVGSVVVTKLDGTGKGGGALSGVAKLNVPISFVGVGEGIEDLEDFNARSFVNRLLGMGDLGALMEAMKSAEEGERESLERVASGKMTLDDMLAQLRAFRRFGSLSKVLESLPIGASQLRAVSKEAGEEKIKKWEAMILSMNKAEKEDPSIIDGSRIRRIARGSGTRPEEVKELLRQYESMKKALKAMRRDKRWLGLLGASS